MRIKLSIGKLLIIFFVLISLFAGLHYFHKNVTDHQSSIVSFQKQLHKKEVEIERLSAILASESNNRDYFQLFKNHLVEYKSLYEEKGVVLLIYENDSLKFWSDNHIPVENYLLKICLDNSMVKLNNGLYEVRRKTENNKVIIGLILIKNDYSFQNAYLNDEFSPGFDLLGDTEINQLGVDYDSPIFSKENQYLFSLKYSINNHNDFLDFVLILLSIFILLITVLILKKITYRLLYRHGFFVYYLAFGLLLLLLRFAMIKFNFANLFFAIDLFSPSLYAHTLFIPSLGDLLLHAVFITYFIYTYYTELKSNIKSHPIIERLTLFFQAIGFSFLFVFAVKITFSLVTDSKITFNINNLLSLSKYSYIAYLSIGILLLGIYILGLIIYTGKLKNFKKSIYYNILLLGFTAYLCFHFDTKPILTCWLAGLIILYYLLSTNRLTQYKITHAIAAIALGSVFTSTILRAEMRQQREQKIKIFAENLSSEKDPVAEYLSIDLQKKIPEDSILIQSLQLPIVSDNLFLNRLKEKYFTGYWEKFDIKFYAYDSLCNPISKSAGAVFDKYTFFEDLFKQNKVANRQHFCYLPIDNSVNAGFLIKFDLYKKLAANKKFIAHVFIEAESKYLSDEIGFPILLLDNSVDNQQDFAEFSYAIYRDGLLKKHHGKFIYNTNLNYYPLDKSAHKAGFINFNNYSHYYTFSSNNNTYLVSTINKTWLNSITFFSYLFCIYSFLVIILLAIAKPKKLFGLQSQSLRNRIQALPIIMVLVALILFGGGTVFYLVKQSEQKNTDNLSDRLQSVLREMEYKLGDEKSISFSSNDYLTYVLSRLSNIFVSDINLYDTNGNLIALSRPKIIEEGLISGKMNPEAYLQMVINHQVQFINKEQIGKLNYLSAYVPFVNSNNVLLGYVNLPYFAKQTELENEISTLLVTLINIYVLLFVISLLVTIFVANRITGPLNLLQQKIAQISFGKQNEPIEWSNQDEIGNLIKEYNRMIVELGESATRLAKSERESAWREMAKQVAHEIKNPLTPLRLNAQLIERTYKEDNAAFDEKFKKFIPMLIEQVDTLTHIANEFSNFAVMPKPNLEKVDLLVVIQSTVQLFRTTTQIEINVINNSTINYINADKEHLLRIFNNLIKNAIQAIEVEKDGKINIQVINNGKNIITSIHDNGHGIKKEEYNLIFVPSFTTKTGGMGLGLAMVKSMVESANGIISFESEEHQGTTFFITFNCFN